MKLREYWHKLFPPPKTDAEIEQRINAILAPFFDPIRRDLEDAIERGQQAIADANEATEKLNKALHR